MRKTRRVGKICTECPTCRYCCTFVFAVHQRSRAAASQQTHPSGVLRVCCASQHLRPPAARRVRAPACCVVGPHGGAPSGLHHHAPEEVRPQCRNQRGCSDFFWKDIMAGQAHGRIRNMLAFQPWFHCSRPKGQ